MRSATGIVRGDGTIGMTLYRAETGALFAQEGAGVRDADQAARIRSMYRSGSLVGEPTGHYSTAPQLPDG